MPAHILQSTIFTAAVWLMAVLLRRHPARVRHALWMAASVKFLVPFSLFVGLGQQMHRDSTPVAPRQMRFVMIEPAPALPYNFAADVAGRRDWLPSMIWGLWLCGSLAVIIRWSKRWRQAVAIVRHSAAGSGVDVPARYSNDLVEPGVFGIVRPVLILPVGIEERLSPAQLEAVVTHELCHVRHRDNLAAAIHKIVEAIFWFHPLVWWIGARLMEERERACDEEVLRLGNDPATYAESILQICRFGIETPLPCVSGITGDDLKRRIRDIMSARPYRQLGAGKKVLLAAMALTLVLIPVGAGLAHPARPQAQSAAPLRFDVASVKVSPQRFSIIAPERSGGRIRWTADLMFFLSYAYRLEPWRLSGAVPGRDMIYEIEATTDAKATDDQVRLMFQSLLTDRFKMSAHRETKEVSGYALSVAKGGFKLPEATGEPAPEMAEWLHKQKMEPADVDGRVVAMIQSAEIAAIAGRRASMLQLAEALQRVLRTAVLDHTGLSGKYDFAIEFAPNDPNTESDKPGILTAVERVGLKLEKDKGPVEVLVIDHIEKVPTQN